MAQTLDASQVSALLHKHLYLPLATHGSDCCCLDTMPEPRGWRLNRSALLRLLGQAGKKPANAKELASTALERLAVKHRLVSTASLCALPDEVSVTTCTSTHRLGIIACVSDSTLTDLTTAACLQAAVDCPLVDQAQADVALTH
jgi:hypothetical protein